MNTFFFQRAALLAFTIRQDEAYIPVPSATRGILFFSHVIFAAGFASGATHVPSCEIIIIIIKTRLKQKNCKNLHSRRDMFSGKKQIIISHI